METLRGRLFADGYSASLYNGAREETKKVAQTQTNPRRAKVKPAAVTPAFNPSAPRTELGRELMARRAEIVASGEPLLDWDGAAREIAERRGDHDTDVY
jgi:hypothetical protein